MPHHTPLVYAVKHFFHCGETMSSAEDIAEIAAGLSAGQIYLLKLAATNEYAVTLNWRDLYRGELIQCLSPFDHGKRNTCAFKITPLGLAVRAVLEGE